MRLVTMDRTSQPPFLRIPQAGLSLLIASFYVAVVAQLDTASSLKNSIEYIIFHYLDLSYGRGITVVYRTIDVTLHNIYMNHFIN